MIRSSFKKIFSERQLEKILRAKQYLHDSSVLKKDFKILPPIKHRIINEVITISPISEITIAGWRNLILLYEKAGNEEKEEFRNSAKAMILADTTGYIMLETGYIRKIFAAHESMYLEFLGTAYYAKGDLQKAYTVFETLQAKAPSEHIMLYMARCLMHIKGKDEVVQLLVKATDQYPHSTILLLALANAYYRNGKTALANQTLGRVSKDALAFMKSKAHNLDILDKEITEVLANKTVVRTVEKLGFQAYTEESVQYYWETLFCHFVARNRFQHGWSDLCYITETKIEQFFKKHTDIKTVLNFGVFCAVPDYNLAVRNPGINFIGVDREQSTKNLNDSAFQANNLSFLALDMLDTIYDEKTEVKAFVKETISKQGEMMIFHARTATLIYPEALKRFYKACAKLGVKYIALYENMCLSRLHMQYFDFDNLPADSIPYFSIMMIHNYKKFLEEAGYEIVDQEVWNYSDLLWESKDLYGAESYFGLADGHVALLAKLK